MNLIPNKGMKSEFEFEIECNFVTTSCTKVRMVYAFNKKNYDSTRQLIRLFSNYIMPVVL